jgi:hypothetical protein
MLQLTDKQQKEYLHIVIFLEKHYRYHIGGHSISGTPAKYASAGLMATSDIPGSYLYIHVYIFMYMYIYSCVLFRNTRYFWFI